MLNLDNLKTITNGDQSLLDELLKTFIHTTREDMLNLTKAVNNRQRSLVVQMAHRIKGGAAIVGASQLVIMATSMEAMPLSCPEEQYEALLSSMQDNFSAIEGLYPGF